MTADHTVVASFPIAITISAGPGGTISPPGTIGVVVPTGNSQTFTFTPYAGNSISQVLVDGAPVTFTGNTYTFSGITTSHTISVSFSPPSNTPPFNIIDTNWKQFGPDNNNNLPGYPIVTVTKPDGTQVQVPADGWQDGAYVNGQAVYIPWDASAGGNGSFSSSINNNTPISTLLIYNAAQGGGIVGYSNASNWTWFDLSTLNWTGKTGNPPVLNTPTGYNGGITVGNMVYLAPDPHQQYPVFVQYDSTQLPTDPLGNPHPVHLRPLFRLRRFQACRGL